jgi:zinc protease
LLAALVPCGAIEIEGLPKPGEPRRPVLAQPHEKTLPNGLRVIVIERPGLPLLSAELIIKNGAETDPPRLAGLAHFTAGLLKRGTKTRTAPQIAQEIEALGAKIESEAGWDATKLKLTTLSANAEAALAILADLACQPAFAKDEIERARREALDELRLTLEQPGAVARLAAARAALGSSPYAHPLEGTPASLTRLKREEITAHHTRIFRPDNALLVIAGNVTAAESFALAEKVLGNWAAPAADPASVPTTVTPPAPRVILIDMPNAGQAAVFLAAPSIARRADDWFAGKVANTVLGGGYTSRLNAEIRVKRGLSYGASSSLATRRTGGLFLASAQTKNQSALEVVRVMQTEIARLSDELVPADFLQTRQSVLTGAFARKLETNAGYAEQFGEFALYGLPLESLNRYFDDIDSIGPADLQTFAARHLAADAFTVVIAGQAKLIEQPLRAAFPKLEVIALSRLDLDSPALRAAGKR